MAFHPGTVVAGIGIDFTGVPTRPTINNAGVLTVTGGTGTVTSGTAQNPIISAGYVNTRVSEFLSANQAIPLNTATILTPWSDLVIQPVIPPFTTDTYTALSAGDYEAHVSIIVEVTEPFSGTPVSVGPGITPFFELYNTATGTSLLGTPIPASASTSALTFYLLPRAQVVLTGVFHLDAGDTVVVRYNPGTDTDTTNLVVVTNNSSHFTTWSMRRIS